MSHDIRTPLNGIIGMVNMGNQYADDPQMQQKIREKEMEVLKYLVSLVNDVLDMFGALPEEVAVLRYSSAHVMNLQQKAKVPKKTMKAMDKADRENTIVDMYVNGHSFEDIMAVSGYNSRSSVFSVLNKHGVELNRGKFKGPLGKRKPKDGQ